MNSDYAYALRGKSEKKSDYAYALRGKSEKKSDYAYAPGEPRFPEGSPLLRKREALRGMEKKMNRKGNTGDYVAFFSFFFIMVIIGAGIAGGAYIFFAKGYDFREADAGLLANKIKNCIAEKGESVLDKNAFFEKCSLNKAVIEKDNLIKVCKNSEDCISDGSPVFASGGDFTECGIKGAKGNEGYVKCTETSFKIDKDSFFVITGSKLASSRRVG